MDIASRLQEPIEFISFTNFSILFPVNAASAFPSDQAHSYYELLADFTIKTCELTKS